MSLPIFPLTGLDTVIETYAKGGTVLSPALVYFDFTTGPMALWGGEYNPTWGGVTWTGIGKSGVLVSIDGLEQTGGTTAKDMTFKVSGVDADMLAAFKAEDRSNYVGQLVGVALQLLDSDWQPLCSPMWMNAGIMGRMTCDASTDVKDGVITCTRTLTLPASNIFSGRSLAPSSYFTDRDQQTRYPGDQFLSFVASIQETAIRQPWR